MRPFAYRRVSSVEEAVRAAGGADPAVAAVANPRQYLAGGTTLVDLMKLDVMRPEHVVDITPLQDLPDLGRIDVQQNMLRLGAMVTMAEAADHPDIADGCPVLVESLRLAASQQLRNMATLGGNLLQRTRCYYFRDTSWSRCNRRIPGSGCQAIGGVNRNHAVLGTSANCIATYPGDFAQALMALDATLELTGPGGTRTMPIADLHRVPGDTPHIETALQPGELITAINVPFSDAARRSRYVKVRDRQSYEFALASAAVALAMDDSRVTEARIALGGLATVPWRAREAECQLVGQVLDEETARKAADVAFADAQASGQNAFKIPLGKATLVRAPLETARLEI